MAPDPDKMGNMKGRKKGKYAQYKFYEKKRRDIINEKMEALAQLIPTFDKEWTFI
jgi:Helix-loop-helix DNA-binding domain